MTDESYRIAWIENLKLIGMLGILTFHFWLFFNPNPPSSLLDINMPFQILGFQGDFIFLATSGLGLTLMLEKKKPTWIKFFYGRVKRIYIPYWVTILSILVYQMGMTLIRCWDKPFLIPSSLKDWVLNIFLVNTPGLQYFSSHYWFLATLLEMYLIFPVLFKFSKWTKEAGLIIIIAMHILFRIYSNNIPLSGWLSFIVWINPFYYGIYIGQKLSTNREKTENAMHRLFPLGILAWAVGTMATYSSSGQVWANPITSAGVIIVLFKICSLNWAFPKLNRISYEIYLVRLPFVGFYRHFFGFVTQPKLLIYAFFLTTTYYGGIC